MSDQDKERSLRNKEDRGRRAQNLLDNELFVEALEKMENEIMEGWKNSAADEETVRYNAYLMHRLLKNFQEHFKHIVIEGKTAKRSLLELEKPSVFNRIKQ